LNVMMNFLLSIQNLFFHDRVVWGSGEKQAVDRLKKKCGNKPYWI
jgi:hypothetical protein